MPNTLKTISNLLKFLWKGNINNIMDIEFDYTNVREEVIGSEHGINVDFEFKKYANKTVEILNYINLERNVEGSKYQFLNFCDDRKSIAEVLEYSDMVKGKFDHLGMLCAAGPTVGIRAIVDALLMPYRNSLDSNARNGYPTFDIIDNVDPEEINGLASIRNIKKSLFLTISKNGVSPVTMSSFMLAKRRLEYEIGENYRMHMVTCAGAEASILRQLSQQEGYKFFDIPYNVVGRYSIFSQCGILPLALLGINVEEFLMGAKDAIETMLSTDLSRNEAAKISVLQHALSMDKGKNVSVIMPYSSRLKSVSKWCSRVMADVLCQTKDIDGNDVNVSYIPYTAYGCTDQDTLLQMFHQGQNNKLINFFKIKNFTTDNILPNFFGNTPIGYLRGKSLSDLMDAELNATKMTLINHQRPNITITIPEITPYYMGYFVSMYIVSMLIQALLLNLDPFAHPDRDMLYDYLYAQVGQVGYEATYQEMQDALNRHKFTSASASAFMP